MFHVKHFIIITFAVCHVLLPFSGGTQETFSRLSCSSYTSSGDLYNEESMVNNTTLCS